MRFQFSIGLLLVVLTISCSVTAIIRALPQSAGMHDGALRQIPIPPGTDTKYVESKHIFHHIRGLLSHPNFERVFRMSSRYESDSDTYYFTLEDLRPSRAQLRKQCIPVRPTDTGLHVGVLQFPCSDADWSNPLAKQTVRFEIGIDSLSMLHVTEINGEPSDEWEVAEP